MEREHLAIDPSPNAVRHRIARANPEAGEVIERIGAEGLHGAVPTVFIWKTRKITAIGLGVRTRLLPSEAARDD